VLPSGEKQILGLLAAITFEVVPFRAYAPFPRASARGIHNFRDWCWHLVKTKFWACWPPSPLK
jgi:hypothetical protein